MGLAVLPYINEIYQARKSVVDYYDQNLVFSKFAGMKLQKDLIWNYSYYPIIFNSEEDLLISQKILHQNNIQPRRYFYPSLNTLPYVFNQEMPISESISKRILCLPLFFDLSKSSQDVIIKILNDL